MLALKSTFYFYPMKKMLTFLILVLSFGMISCNRCQTCTAMQDGQVVEREVCGRKRNVASLINALESDTEGVGPWVCEK